MTGKMGVPNHHHSWHIRFNYHRMQCGTMLFCPFVAKIRLESERYTRQTKAKKSIGCKVVQFDSFSTFKKPRDLLVLRCALMELLIKIIREQGLSFFFPLFTVGACKLNAG